MSKFFRIVCGADRRRAFTLVEILVAMTVLVVLIGLIAQMTSGVASIVGQGQAHIDTDAQARALLDRMAVDFGSMVRRPDVDYYLKGRPIDLKQAGNDQIAFYSEVPGYFTTNPDSTPDPTTQSSVSLIAYRVNTNSLHLERLCKGLTWNGASGGANKSVGFLPVPLASALPSQTPAQSPSPAPTPTPPPSSYPPPLWPSAADPTEKDVDYEELAPQVFRFEYYYVLKGQSTTSRSMLSDVPWYAAAPVNHTSLNGMQDVAGIGVLIAVLDQKNRALISKTQLAQLASQMEDAPDPNISFATPGDIELPWSIAVNNSALPRAAKSAIRIYSRCFYLNGVSP